jgi:hypothetical protein
VLRSAVAAGQALTGDIAGEMSLGAARIPVPKLAVPSPTRDATGAIAAMALYAGESVEMVTQVLPAGQVVRELAEGAERLLRAAAS